LHNKTPDQKPSNMQTLGNSWLDLG